MTRDRGNYGPLDHDRDWLLGWAADQTAGYVHHQTVGAALRPAMPYVSEAFRGARGARRAWEASRMIGNRAEAEKPPARIGQELFHSAGDRVRAIAQLSTGFQALASDLAAWQMSNLARPDASKTAQWISADVTPMLEEWKAFAARENKSWWTKIATSWDTFTQWWDRLKQARALARAHGVMLQSADPAPLPKTIWQHGAEGTGSEATAILGVLKIGVLTAIGIMGAAGLYGAIKNIRSRAKIAEDRMILKSIVHEELAQARGQVEGSEQHK